MQIDVNIVLGKLKEEISTLNYNRVFLEAQLEQLNKEKEDLQRELEEKRLELENYKEKEISKKQV